MDAADFGNLETQWLAQGHGTRTRQEFEQRLQKLIPNLFKGDKWKVSCAARLIWRGRVLTRSLTAV